MHGAQGEAAKLEVGAEDGGAGLQGGGRGLRLLKHAHPALGRRQPGSGRGLTAQDGSILSRV